MPESTEFVSAERFRISGRGWQYRIPFSPVVDPKHGRIMVGVEPMLQQGIIGELHVWFDHHNIENLQKSFSIPTPQACIDTGLVTYNFRTSDASSFFGGVWRVAPCKEHLGSLIFYSYPPDDASAVIIDTLTSSISIHYEIRNSPEAPSPGGYMQ
jgi:hypothetical protein